MSRWSSTRHPRTTRPASVLYAGRERRLRDSELAAESPGALKPSYTTGLRIGIECDRKPRLSRVETQGQGVDMCDKDDFEKDRLEYEARGLVTRRQFGVLLGAGVAMLLPKVVN